MPLQLSTDLAWPPEQARAPLEQVELPIWQRVPVMPAVEVLVQSAALPVGQQAWPSHGSVRLSSGVPLQSLSLPSQLSATGPVAFWHTLTPCTQASVPRTQVPTLLAP